MNIFVVDTPYMAPGKCAHCGGTTNRDGRKYLDTGITVPRYGKIYLCSFCIVEIGKLFGLIDQDKLEGAEADRDTLMNSAIKLEEENGRLRRALSELDFLPRYVSEPLAVEPEPEPIHNPAPEPESAGNKPAVGNGDGPEESESGPAESNDGGRSSKLPGNDVRKLRSTKRIGV